MHLPDEFINSGAAAGLAGAAAAMVGFAVHKVRQAFMEKLPVLKMRLATFPDFGGESGMSLESRLSKYGREQVWRMAVAGSLIFAAQMVNFPVAAGTSGHLLGGVLAALIVGPFAALIVMAIILSVQALVFGDGGIVALGANIFNMGVVSVLGGYAFFRFLMRGAKDAKKNVFAQRFHGCLGICHCRGSRRFIGDGGFWDRITWIRIASDDAHAYPYRRCRRSDNGHCPRRLDATEFQTSQRG